MNNILGSFHKLETLCENDFEGKEMIQWVLNLKECESSSKFLSEAIWVIMCSGISYKAARTMEKKYHETGICKHPHKNKAVKSWEKNYKEWWDEYSLLFTESKKLEFLKTLPYMGGKALVYQLAKNLGFKNVCKPDVHLNRLAQINGYRSPQIMCKEISDDTGKFLSYIDTILWFSAMKGWAYNLK
jgi:hypothetical protein